MSSSAFGALVRKRQEAPAGRSTRDDPPGLKTYVDTLAALVPAEVLLAHAAVVMATTETRVVRDQSVTVVTDPETLHAVFWILVALSVVFYVAGFQKRHWSIPAAIGALIPPLAFVAWTAGQPASAFDAVWPGTGSGTRTAIVVIAALVLGLLSALVPFALNKRPNEKEKTKAAAERKAAAAGRATA